MEFTNSIKDDDNKHSTKALQPFMEAVWMFMEALSHSAMGDEERKVLRERFMECWLSSHGSHKNTPAQTQAQMMKKNGKIQRAQRAEESSERATCSMHDKTAGKGTLQAVDEGEEAALEKGRTDDALEVKWSPNERESLHGPVDNNSMVNNHFVVSNEVTVPRQRVGCPSSGSPCILSSPHEVHVNSLMRPMYPAPHATNEVHVIQQEMEKVRNSISGIVVQNSKDKMEKAKDSSGKLLPNCVRSENSSQHVNPQQTFAQVVKQGQEANIRQVSSPNFISSSLLNEVHDPDLDKNGGARVIVPTEILNRRRDFCKLSIIGRVVLAKGEEAWNSKKLREKLNEVWNFKSSWRLISLGKGFFHVLLTSQEEFGHVWMRGPINLKPGVMRFQKWSFGFDPTKEKSTNAQVWFRFFNLPWCLWDSFILTALSRKLGTPIRFDDNTINGDFGHYARVLIDVDLSKNFKEVLQLDCGKEIFDVKVVPENIPNFCNACHNIGHSSGECRLLRRKVENAKENAKVLNDGKDTKAELAIQNRMEVHRNKGKGISHNSSPFRQEEMGGSSEFQNLHESAKGSHKNKGMEERVPDIENQALSVSLPQGSMDIHTSNKFAALEVHEDKEMGNANNELQNSGVDEANGVDKVQKVPICKRDVNHTLKDIRRWVEQEKRKINHPAEDSEQIGEKGICLTPKTPRRWSDIQDEEEEKEAQEANSRVYVPKTTDILSFERNGELTEILMSNGKIRFTPIPDKNIN